MILKKDSMKKRLNQQNHGNGYFGIETNIAWLDNWPWFKKLYSVS